MTLDNRYRSLLGDGFDTISTNEVDVSYVAKIGREPVFNGEKIVDFTHKTQTINSKLFFNFTSPQNPTVKHNGIEYIYDEDSGRRVEKGYLAKQSYNVLLFGGEIAKAIAKSFDADREDQSH